MLFRLSHTSPTDFMNWYLSKINSVISPSLEQKTNNSMKSIPQEESFDDVEDEDNHDMSYDLSYEKESASMFS
jgi:predicted ATP-binding protein involved in virulence